MLPDAVGRMDWERDSKGVRGSDRVSEMSLERSIMSSLELQCSAHVDTSSWENKRTLS